MTMWWRKSATACSRVRSCKPSW